MRGARSRALSLTTLACLLAGAACVDLFHSTDFETLCTGTPDACASDAGLGDGRSDAPDVVDAGPTDFCLASSAAARTRAAHACAWLGACSVPFDQDALGACMLDAIEAYDCLTNPNNAVAPGPLHTLWDALWRATTCDEVLAAVNPAGVACTGTGFACGGSVAPDVLLECVDSKGGPESCLVEGRVCADNGQCGASGAASPCGASRCDGTIFHDCVGASDLGYDCRYFGAGTCSVSDAGPGCDPTFSHGGGSACAPANAVTCAGDVATACPAGKSVSVNCAALTGPGSCTPGTPSPSWNVAGACQGAGSCTAGCDGDTVTDCAQGASFAVACSSVGLGACRKVSLASGAGYACTPPP